jgi:hypothetical protein
MIFTIRTIREIPAERVQCPRKNPRHAAMSFPYERIVEYLKGTSISASDVGRLFWPDVTAYRGRKNAVRWLLGSTLLWLLLSLNIVYVFVFRGQIIADYVGVAFSVRLALYEAIVQSIAIILLTISIYATRSVISLSILAVLAAIKTLEIIRRLSP